MIETVVDTHVLADLLKQFTFNKPNRQLGETEFLTSNILKKINSSIESNGYEGSVVTSSFGFVEILNQFEKIRDSRYELSRIIAILRQPPDWFIVEPFTKETVYNLIKIPKYNLKGDSIELADAIHVATAIQRGPMTYLATHDGRLKSIDYVPLKIQLLF